MSASDSSSKPIELNAAAQKYMRDLLNPFKQWFFLLFKLPAALFMGVRVRSINTERCEVTVPYGWRSQNPFKSTYFAAQAAAAEMSTGVLAMMALQGKGAVSMLVADIRGEFIKKANKKATFTCSEGHKIFEAVERAIATKEGQAVTIESIGTQPNEQGGDPIVVSKFYITWTFKAKG